MNIDFTNLNCLVDFEDFYVYFFEKERNINGYTCTNGLNNFNKIQLDLHFKSLVDSGVYSRYCRCMKYKNCCNLLRNEFNLSIEKLKNNLISSIIEPFKLFDLLVCKRYYLSLRSKVHRLRKRLDSYFNCYDNLVFLTLTFTDSVLLSTTFSTRRTYVRKFLKSCCNDYVANVDFGDLHCREHYHAIVTNFVDYSSWSFGAVNGKRIVVKNSGAFAHYLDKLTSHAYKVGTGLSTRLIYSKSCRSVH